MPVLPVPACRGPPALRRPQTRGGHGMRRGGRRRRRPKRTKFIRFQRLLRGLLLHRRRITQGGAAPPPGSGGTPRASAAPHRACGAGHGARVTRKCIRHSVVVCLEERFGMPCHFCPQQVARMRLCHGVCHTAFQRPGRGCALAPPRPGRES